MPNARHHAELALLPDGWARDVVFEVDAAGDLVALGPAAGAEPAPRLGGPVLPGMPNLHSHAFQRAIAGLAERHGPAHDSFWSWREAMYKLAATLTPERLHAIALGLYRELLVAGYTAVCEFHYVHHRADGRPYADPAAMAEALTAAAAEAGIGLTLLPALYQVGGFDGRAPSERQRRFVHATDAYLALVERLAARRSPALAVGVALHSLRAVPPAAIVEVLDADPAPSGPIHIHVAEQLAEVDDCLAERGMRPVAWLLDRAALDPRWCLVHATHVIADEIAGMARAGVVAGLCPTTEANLGDGVFPLAPWRDAGGAFGIGSDSHVCVSPLEELRWLEYGQRLARLRRNVAASAAMPSTGEALWRGALIGGAQAAGRALGALAPGHRADWIVLDAEHPALAGKPLEALLDCLVFAADTRAIRETWVGGRRVAADGRWVGR